MDDELGLPRGRLRIVCKPSEDQAEIELPFRLLFVGDFVGLDERPIEERVPVRVTPETFGKVMAAHVPSLDVTVTTRDGRGVRVPLAFRSLDDFGPDRIAEHVPETARLLVLRDALTALKERGDVRAFRAALPSLVDDASERDALLASLGLRS